MNLIYNHICRSKHADSQCANILDTLISGRSNDNQFMFVIFVRYSSLSPSLSRGTVN